MRYLSDKTFWDFLQDIMYQAGNFHDNLPTFAYIMHIWLHCPITQVEQGLKNYHFYTDQIYYRNSEDVLQIVLDVGKLGGLYIELTKTGYYVIPYNQDHISKILGNLDIENINN